MSSKFQMAADGPTGTTKHKYEICVEGNELRVHSTMPLGQFLEKFENVEGIDVLDLVGTYQIMIKVGKLFSVETTENRVKRIMDVLMVLEIATKKVTKKKKKNTDELSSQFNRYTQELNEEANNLVIRVLNSIYEPTVPSEPVSRNKKRSKS